MDHVDQYRRPKDESGNEIIEKGCAPKTPTPSPTPSPVTSPEPAKEKAQKKKKASKDKKKKKTIKKKYEYSDSDSDGHCFPDGKMRRNTKLSDKPSKGAKDDDGWRSKEKRGRTWAREDVSPLPKQKSVASTSESILRIGRKRTTSTSQSRQSYRDSVSRSRSRSRDRSRRHHNDEHARITTDRHHSKARDWSEPREIKSSKKKHCDRSGKAKHTHR